MDELRANLIPSTLALVDDALVLLHEVFDAATHMGAGAEGAEGDIADFSFLGLSQLRPKRVRLVALSADTPAWEIVAECGSAKRRIRKALEVLAVPLFGDGAPEHSRAILESSLLVRREYAALRAVILVPRPESDADLRAFVRGVGTRFAMTIGSQAFPRMRVRDRVDLRALQSRIIDWLRRKGDATEGRRLYDDLTAFARIIALISRREEIVGHDTTVLRRLESLLEATDHARQEGSTAADTPSVRELLRAVEGLDEDLDRATSEPIAATALLEVVRRVLSRVPGAMPHDTRLPEGPDSI